MEANLSIMFQSVRGTKQYWFLKVTGNALILNIIFGGVMTVLAY